MKPTPSLSKTRKPGLTLLEMTVVILVLLSFISILFIGARAWKYGSDRSCCILNVRTAQQAIRGYANAHELAPGDTLPAGLTRKTAIIGPGNFIPSLPVCPGGGSYDGQDLTTVPEVGTVVMSCTYSDGFNHLPDRIGDW